MVSRVVVMSLVVCGDHDTGIFQNRSNDGFICFTFSLMGTSKHQVFNTIQSSGCLEGNYLAVTRPL